VSFQAALQARRFQVMVYAAMRLIHRTPKVFILLLPVGLLAKAAWIAFRHIKRNRCISTHSPRTQGFPKRIIDNEHIL